MNYYTQNHPLPHVAPTAQVSQPFPPEIIMDIEKSEPIVRLLADIRNDGMDILFPQTSHDKVSAI